MNKNHPHIPRCKKELKKFCEENMISYREIVGRTRKRAAVERRRRACHFLRSKGFSSIAIGSTINRDHTSVLHLLKKS